LNDTLNRAAALAGHEGQGRTQTRATCRGSACAGPAGGAGTRSTTEVRVQEQLEEEADEEVLLLPCIKKNQKALLAFKMDRYFAEESKVTGQDRREMMADLLSY
jgi:hypothetical protein